MGFSFSSEQGKFRVEGLRAKVSRGLDYGL